MKRVFQMIGIAWLLVFFGLIYHPVVRYLRLPQATRSSWVESLATNHTIFSKNRELKARGQNQEDLFGSYGNLEPMLKANEQKRRLYTTLMAGRGKTGLRGEYSIGVDSGSAVKWLLVEDGKLTYVHEDRGDFDSPWEIIADTPRGIKLGFLRADQFVEGEPSLAESPSLVFQIELSRAGKSSYFY